MTIVMNRKISDISDIFTKNSLSSLAEMGIGVHNKDIENNVTLRKKPKGRRLE